MKINVFVYGFIIVISCLLQAMFGIMQALGLFYTSSVFKVTGSFDNPAGFASCLCIGMPFIGFMLLKNNNKYIRYGGWVIGLVIMVAVILSQSRAAVISIAFICFIFFCMEFSRKKCIKYLSFVCFALLLFGCYWLKKDSADGRLLIWQCSMDMVKEAPWLGHGIGSFEANYMDYQADYFRQHKQSRYFMLADNVKHPFNEFLGILLNFGFISLLIIFVMIAILVYCYKSNPCMEKQIVLYSLVSIGIFSLFSYPFSYPFTWIITTLCVFILIREYITKIFVQSMIKNVICILVLFCSFGGIYKLLERVKAEKEWGRASSSSALLFSGSYNKALQTYEILEIKFHDNPYFLYNYAAMLLENKQYKESLQIALQCRKYWADYDLELIIGDNYQELANPKAAKRYYDNASMMCPSRFLPLYRLFHLYKNIEDRERMLSVAKLIIDKPIKIKTPVIQMMKREMEKEQMRIFNKEQIE